MEYYLFYTSHKLIYVGNVYGAGIKSNTIIEHREDTVAKIGCWPSPQPE